MASERYSKINTPSCREGACHDICPSYAGAQLVSGCMPAEATGATLHHRSRCRAGINGAGRSQSMARVLPSDRWTLTLLFVGPMMTGGGSLSRLRRIGRSSVGARRVCCSKAARGLSVAGIWDGGTGLFHCFRAYPLTTTGGDMKGFVFVFLQGVVGLRISGCRWAPVTSDCVRPEGVFERESECEEENTMTDSLVRIDGAESIR